MRASGETLAPSTGLLWNPAFPRFTSNAGQHFYHSRNAQRFFSKCRSSWRRQTKNHHSRDPQKPFEIYPTRLNLRSRINKLEESDESPHYRKLIIDRLNVLATEADGTEFSALAGQLASRLQADKIKQGDEFYHFVPIIRQNIVGKDQTELDTQIKYALHGHLVNKRIRQFSIKEQVKLADLRHPLEWYPRARMLQRTIHLHVGPTNSGKTYHALKRLEQAKTGVYAGPLRLLAYEVYTRLNALGKTCHLITGDDRRISEDAGDGTEAMISCTVEMVPVNTTFDVGVIDEIQMIGHPERAWAWSQAFLGLQAKELHLCGEARTAPLIRELAAAMGDKLVLHEYERLSPLMLAPKSLDGDLKRLKKGDCLVVFSRKEIHSMKKYIENMTGKRVAIIYGSLPPDTRARQANLFNDPDNEYDYLVATDAIGMGLNLNITRIVFESTYKYNGRKFEPIPTAHLKQIAGRAGRYRVAPQAMLTSDSLQSSGDKNGGELLTNPTSIPIERSNVGLVTTLERMDYPRIRRAMKVETEPVMAAGIFPPGSVVVKFAAYFAPGTPFSYVLRRLHEVSTLNSRYFLCDLKDQIYVADIIEPVKNLTIEDRIMFCAAPVSGREVEFHSIVVSFAQCVANSEEVSSDLLDIPTLPLEILDRELTLDRTYLAKLEVLHKALILYLWLSYRFAGVFPSRDMAIHLKGIVEEKIDQVLAQSSTSRKGKLKSLRQLAMLEELGEAIDAGGDAPKTKAKPDSRAIGQHFRFELSFRPKDVVRAEKSTDEKPPPEVGEIAVNVNEAPDPGSAVDWQQQSPHTTPHEQGVNTSTA